MAIIIGLVIYSIVLRHSLSLVQISDNACCSVILTTALSACLVVTISLVGRIICIAIGGRANHNT